MQEKDFDAAARGRQEERVLPPRPREHQTPAARLSIIVRLSIIMRLSIIVCLSITIFHESSTFESRPRILVLN